MRHAKQNTLSHMTPNNRLGLRYVMVERRCDLQRLNSYQISGQAIDYKDTSKEDVEVQDEVQNQGSLTSSLSSSAV